jgi:hypothetical protein
MSFDQLTNEVARLNPDEQKRLRAFLVALEYKREGLIDEFSRRLDDRTEGSWVSLDEVKSRLNETP